MLKRIVTASDMIKIKKYSAAGYGAEAIGRSLGIEPSRINDVMPGQRPRKSARKAAPGAAIPLSDKVALPGPVPNSTAIGPDLARRNK